MSNKKINLSIIGLVVLVVGLFGFFQTDRSSLDQSKPAELTTTQQQSEQRNVDLSSNQSSKRVQQDKIATGVAQIERAFKQQQSDIQVHAAGRVKAVLKDDLKGSRHQKFILTLDNGMTVLVAHNIDLAPRIEQLTKGDWVEFYGEYEYSAQGGVIHWTHHDPKGRHVGGWLKHAGQNYQ